MTFFFPENTFDSINAMRGVVGRNVTITVHESNTVCTVSGCTLDPVTNEATDVMCSGCEGLYWIPVYSDYTISGHVRWNFADQDMWEAGGIIPEGDCRVTIKYNVENQRRVFQSHSWSVDDETLYMTKFKLKGIRGPNEEHEPSRITVTLKQESES